MCGLVGAAGTLWATDRKAIKQLLYLDAFRGEHSTGLAVVNDDNVVMTDKEVGHPFYLFQNGGKGHSFLDEAGIIKDSTVRVAIGHNRYATTGKITAENAHPFTQGHITGAHNGTLDKHLLKKLDDASKFEVDSEAIFYNLAKDGTKAIAKIAGAYALTWYDQKAKALFFLRNNDRPLFYARRKDRDAIFWASERWMLEVTLERLVISFDEITSFKPNHLYRLDCAHKNQFDFRKVDLEDLGVYEGFHVPPVTYTNGPMSGKNFHSNTGGNKFWANDYYGNNVFKGNNTNNEPKGWSLDKLKKLVGLPLEFTVTGSATGVSKVEYIKARSTVETDDFEIRIHAQPVELWNKLLNSKAKWMATVKRPVKHFKNGRSELYLLVDMRTIAPSTIKHEVKKELKATTPLPVSALKTIENAVAREDKLAAVFDGTTPLQGFQGRYLDPAEWYRCTGNGCAWCSSDANILEHTTLTWVSHDEFVCGDCKDSPDVKQWLVTKE